MYGLGERRSGNAEKIVAEWDPIQFEVSTTSSSRSFQDGEDPLPGTPKFSRQVLSPVRDMDLNKICADADVEDADSCSCGDEDPAPLLLADCGEDKVKGMRARPRPGDLDEDPLPLLLAECEVNRDESFSSSNRTPEESFEYEEFYMAVTATQSKKKEQEKQARCFQTVPFEEHYELTGRVLGVGSGATVVEAECRRTGRTVAVKKFDKKAMAPKVLDGMRSELDIHTTLVHRHIARVEGVYETESQVHLVLEQLHGGELFARIFELRRLSEADAASLVKQVLLALLYMHKKNIVHRDIKPENIVFEKCGGRKVKLIDLGFAARVPENGMLTHKCGTLHYVAPEILKGRGYDTKADVWSLGSVLYVMLTGEAPFRGKNSSEVQKQNKAGEVAYSETFRSLSPEAQNFVRKLLASDPGARPTAAEALAHPFLGRVNVEDFDGGLEDDADGGSPKAPESLQQVFSESGRLLRDVFGRFGREVVTSICGK